MTAAIMAKAIGVGAAEMFWKLVLIAVGLL